MIPEAAIRALHVAYEYRRRFKKDVVIDMFCYRRYGHNEADDPSFTQPMLYQKIRNHPSVREIYAERLLREEIITSSRKWSRFGRIISPELEQAFEDLKKRVDVFVPEAMSAVSQEGWKHRHSSTPTGVSKELLSQITMAMTTFPPRFPRSSESYRVFSRGAAESQFRAVKSIGRSRRLWLSALLWSMELPCG